jgi:bidirectional [NiFe] hydrogenase diaphorase subunit
MPVITMTINDQLVSGRAGETILELLHEQGIRIPTLCHMDGLEPRGGCRLCLVEVEGTGRLLPACKSPVQEGLSIHTHTEKLLRYRRMLLELMFSERNHVCAVCVMNGRCELQGAAMHAGMDHVRYDYLVPHLPIDASHARFAIDHNRCILCTRCVRVCDDVEGAHTWDVAGRGVNSRVITDLNQPWGSSTSCTSCGKCVQVCPTGALFEKGRPVAAGSKDRRPFLPWLKVVREERGL